MISELPEGVTLNSPRDEFEVVLPCETIQQWMCTKCQITLEAQLTGEEGRWQGFVTLLDVNRVVWQDRLPKVEEKAKKILLENFENRIDRHRRTH